MGWVQWRPQLGQPGLDFCFPAPVSDLQMDMHRGTCVYDLLCECTLKTL